MKRKQVVQLLVGAAISAVALYAIFRDVDFGEFLAAFRTLKPWYLAASLATFYFGVWLRGLRWRMLFQPDNHVPLSHAVGGMFICFGFNSIFPARLGEFARAYFVGKRDGTGISTALGTVVAERLLDGLTILLCLVLAFGFNPIVSPDSPSRDAGAQVAQSSPGERVVFQDNLLGFPVKLTQGQVNGARTGFVVLSLGLIVFMFAVGVPHTRAIILRIMHTMRFIPESLRVKLEGLIHKFALGFRCFSSPKRVLLLSALSVVIWVTNIYSLVFLAWGYPFDVRMGGLQGMAIVVIVCIFITVPAAPGYWGFFEAGVIFGMEMLGLHSGRSLILSYAILLHVTQWLPVVLIGLPWAWKSHLSLDDVQESEETTPPEDLPR